MNRNCECLPRTEPWMGLPCETPDQERIGDLRREIGEQRSRKRDLEGNWQEVQGYLGGLDEVAKGCIGELFTEAIGDAAWEIETRLMTIDDIEDGAYEPYI